MSHWVIKLPHLWNTRCLNILLNRPAVYIQFEKIKQSKKLKPARHITIVEAALFSTSAEEMKTKHMQINKQK